MSVNNTEKINSTRFTMTRLVISIIEEKTGRPIDEIPEKILLKAIDDLGPLDFQETDVRGVNYHIIKPVKRTLKNKISEGKFFDYIERMKNQVKVARKYRPVMDFLRRSNFQVINDILAIAKEGVNKTKIMYDCNLSFSQRNKYFDELIRLGLFQYDKENNVYKTTDLGLDYIYVFQQITKILNDEGIVKPPKLNKVSRNLAIDAFHKNENYRKYRQSYDICALVLEQCSENINEYGIRSHIGLDHTSSGSYIEFLTEKDLLRKVDSKKYKTSLKGSLYLEECLNLILFIYDKL